MNSRRVLPVLAGLLASQLATLSAADGVTASPISTSASHKYSEVTCTSGDDLACADTLQIAEETRDELDLLLNLGSHWRFPVHIHILTPDDPLTAKINRQAAAVFSDDTSMRIEAVVPVGDPDARIFIQRQFVTAILWEKFFAQTKRFDANTKLDIVPVWLVEGLREWLDEDPEHNREGVVRRAVQGQRAPSLMEVTGWKEISKDRLMGLWQRSFSFYLVNSLLQVGQRRSEFQRWLDTYSSNQPQSANLLFPTEMAWQRELVDATKRGRDIVYTWDETATELTAAQALAIPGDKPADTRVGTIDNILTFPRDAKFNDVVQRKVLDLTSLELRAHVSWRPIIALYRFGLQSLINDPKPDRAKDFLKQAHDRRLVEMVNHQELVDYMNWFEVTKNYAGNLSRFNVYFTTAKETERAQADPTHPNPIRANLLQIESQL